MSERILPVLHRSYDYAFHGTLVGRLGVNKGQQHYRSSNTCRATSQAPRSRHCFYRWIQFETLQSLICIRKMKKAHSSLRRREICLQITRSMYRKFFSAECLKMCTLKLPDPVSESNDWECIGWKEMDTQRCCRRVETCICKTDRWTVKKEIRWSDHQSLGRVSLAA